MHIYNYNYRQKQFLFLLIIIIPVAHVISISVCWSCGYMLVRPFVYEAQNDYQVYGLFLAYASNYPLSNFEIVMN